MIRKKLAFSLAGTAAAAFAFSASWSLAGPIAHWSFDTPTITVGANGITAAADSTGNHNATTQYGGTGGTGGGAPQIDSVAGQFGQAASFTNANANGQAQANFAWMSIPQLTEIAGPSGGDFTVSVWSNVPDQASWDDNPILVDWGNAPANTNRFTYWFQLDNVDSNAGLRPRAQMRNANTPISPMNIDVIATTLSSSQAGTAGGATNFDDGIWHHLAWTWTKSTGEMRFYTDGVLRHTQTTVQPPATRDLLISDSPIGAIGAKRDNNRYFRGALDELWVVGRALTPGEVSVLHSQNIVIPEPASLVLALFGVVAMGLAAGRRH
jgi:hypothetical protein